MKPIVSRGSLIGNRLQIPPEPDEIEISVFGPGYGESILIHLGQNKWFIVDSCIEPICKEPASLIYLNNINVDPARSVKQIIATHWHDDHVRGLGKIIKACSSAEFVCSDALRSSEFLDLVCAYGSRTLSTIAENSGVDEFQEVLKALQERKKFLRTNYMPKWAIANRLLWNDFLDSSGARYDCSIYSLSPSDASILASRLDISFLLPQDKEPTRRLMAITPNRSAVVLWVTIGSINILLGSDLEEKRDSDAGWSVIINSTSRPRGKASLFKIPHHGSQNAHNPEVWTDMLDSDPIAVLTPFENGNNQLPTNEDIGRICSLTSKAYSTAVPRSRRTARRNPTVEKTIRETVRNIRQLHTSMGHIRLRAKVSSQWKIELFGDAVPLSRIYTS